MAKRNDDQYDVSEYPEELQPKARRVLEKRVDNHRRIGGIEQKGVAIDLGTARVEFLMQGLAEIGVISQDQLLDLAWSWEENLALQIAQVEDRIDMQMRQQREEMERKMREAQLTNGQQPQAGILLPNGRVVLPKSDPQPQEEGKADGE